MRVITGKVKVLVQNMVAVLGTPFIHECGLEEVSAGEEREDMLKNFSWKVQHIERKSHTAVEGPCDGQWMWTG